MRKNFRKFTNRIDEVKKHIDSEHKNGRKVYWDKLGNGIFLCSGREYDTEARYRPERYIELKSNDDVIELFTHYEDEE